MGDVMVQTGREVWEINIVGTVESNRTGGGSLGATCSYYRTKGDTKANSPVSPLSTHNSTKPLMCAIWVDNNFVKALSNFHSPAILEGGIKRRNEI